MDITVSVDVGMSTRVPHISVFAIRAQGVTSPAVLDLSLQRLDEATRWFRSEVPSPENILSLPVISQWREAYKAMGVKPSTFRSSLEALGRRVVAGKDLAIGIPAVDLYNACSIRHLACLGAYDAKKLNQQPLQLRLCSPQTDRFSPLGGRSEDFPLSEGLVVYGQGDEVLCWGFNCRDSARTCLDQESDDILVMAEAVTAEQALNARRALSALSDQLDSLGAAVSDMHELGPGARHVFQGGSEGRCSLTSGIQRR